MFKNTEQHTPYTGDLVRPIMLKPISVINSRWDNALYLHEEIEKRLKLLHTHHSVSGANTQSSEKLVLCMAKEHVPGFRVEYPSRVPSKTIGRPTYWAGKEGVLLYSDIQKILKKGVSISQACKELSSWNRYAGIPHSSLRQRYYEIKKRWGAEHCLNMGIILKKLPKDLGDGFLASYFPDGNAVFNEKKIVTHMVRALSKL